MFVSSENNEKPAEYSDSTKAQRRRESRENRIYVGHDLSFAANEAYKLLRTNLILSMTDEKVCKIIGITSALRGEGKSSTALNLANSFAETGKNVLLIDADMRIPAIAKRLNINRTPGLSNALAGLCTIDEALQSSGLQKLLYVVSAGDIPPNPSELLSSAKMENILKDLSEVFNYIIIDLPPVTLVSDTLAISKCLSGIIIVVRQDYCDQYSLSEVVHQLQFSKIKILGFVLNDADMSKGKYKKYKGKYHYRQYYDYKNNDAALKPDENEAEKSKVAQL